MQLRSRILLLAHALTAGCREKAPDVAANLPPDNLFRGALSHTEFRWDSTVHSNFIVYWPTGSYSAEEIQSFSDSTAYAISYDLKMLGERPAFARVNEDRKAAQEAARAPRS